MGGLFGKAKCAIINIILVRIMNFCEHYMHIDFVILQFVCNKEFCTVCMYKYGQLHRVLLFSNTVQLCKQKLCTGHCVCVYISTFTCTYVCIY